MNIKKIQKLNAEIENFRDCYTKDVELWGVQDGPVGYEKLMEFMIEHPHFQQIADSVSKLNRALEAGNERM